MDVKKALIIVDMINDFVHPDGSLYVKGSRSIISYIKKNIDNFHDENKPIFYAIDSHWKNDEELNLFPPHAIKGSWGGNIVNELKPEIKDIVITKRRYPAFFGTDLDIYLHEMNVKEVNIVGVVTHICIFYTAIFAKLLGYNVNVLIKGIYDFDTNLHELSLSQLREVWGVSIVE